MFLRTLAYCQRFYFGEKMSIIVAIIISIVIFLLLIVSVFLDNTKKDNIQKDNIWIGQVFELEEDRDEYLKKGKYIVSGLYSDAIKLEKIGKDIPLYNKNILFDGKFKKIKTDGRGNIYPDFMQENKNEK